MNKYLTIFGSHSQYVEPQVKPNVSYCIQEDEVHYNPWVDPTKLYLRHDNGVFFNSEDNVYVGVDSSGKVIVGTTNDGPRDNVYILVFGSDDPEYPWYGLCQSNNELNEAYINAFGESSITMDNIYTGREWDEFGGTTRYINYGFDLNNKQYGGDYGSLYSDDGDYYPPIYGKNSIEITNFSPGNSSATVTLSSQLPQNATNIGLLSKGKNDSYYTSVEHVTPNITNNVISFVLSDGYDFNPSTFNCHLVKVVYTVEGMNRGTDPFECGCFN